MDLDDELAELVRRFGDRLLRMAYQLTHDRPAAQDLVQESLLQVYRSAPGRARRIDNLEGYLRRVIINEHLRTQRLRASSELITSDLPERHVDDGTDDTFAERDLMWRALGALAPRQRAALVLRYYEELPDREIATLLDCRQATVRSLIARGLAALREQTDAVQKIVAAGREIDRETAIEKETL
jgi:RNA polymerase sigma-70 factor (sigma-E family)